MSNLQYTDDAIEVGRRIRIHREAMGLTQKELSDQTGIDDKTISRHEMGQSRMRLDIYFKLAESLCVTPNDLAPSHYTRQVQKNPFVDLNEKFQNLTESQKRIVYRTMSSLIDNLLDENN